MEHNFGLFVEWLQHNWVTGFLEGVRVRIYSGRTFALKCAYYSSTNIVSVSYQFTNDEKN